MSNRSVLDESMRNLLLAVVLLGCSLAMSRAIAQPVQVSESEFTVLAADMARITEDFERFPIGAIASPLQLRNGIFTGTPSIAAPWCIPSRCLTVGLAPGTFSAFPNGTVLWSTRLIPVASTGDYIVDVVGRSGTQRFSLTDVPFSIDGSFVGFHDPLGLLQVTFSLPTAPFGANYSLDNVVVAIANERPVGVPSLSTGGVLLLALAVLGLAGLTLRRV